MEPILRTEHLTFTYPGEERPTLGDLSLEIAARSWPCWGNATAPARARLAKATNAIPLLTGGRRTSTAWTRPTRTISRPRAPRWAWSSNPDNQISSPTPSRTSRGLAPEKPRRRPAAGNTRVADAAPKQVGMYDFRPHAPHLLSGGCSAWPSRHRHAAWAHRVDPRSSCSIRPGTCDNTDTAHEARREQGITVVLITHHMEECNRREPRHRVLGTAPPLPTVRRSEVFAGRFAGTRV